MRVLVVGNGGREHALVWKLSQSSSNHHVFAANGNAGTRLLAENLPVLPTDIEGIVAAATTIRSDLVVVGPEVPLAMGLVDSLLAAGIPAFGPSRAAAQLESSKAFAHAIMRKYGIPAAESREFTSFAQAQAYVATLHPPLVVKADGLAAGKGAIIAQSLEEAETALSDMLERRVFGDAGDRVVIEEFLQGKEVSLLAFTDGIRVAPMVPACDYKRALDNDAGLNTGGMGCYSPPGFFGQDLIQRATDTVIKPIVHAMKEEGREYRGVIYAGLMIRDDSIRVLEFNARFGDPETQVVLPRLESDLAETLLSCVQGRLDPTTVKWKDQSCVGVVLASGGYPGPYKKGLPISGLDAVDKDVAVFHAGTTLGSDGTTTITNGGRVLAVVGTGDTISSARQRAYDNVARVSFEGMMYRKDIALREVE
ncbi:MAG: phosphoribosylamine--glycine ligase [Dehalococcoidia bacterium]|nr:phosphoribosylamine--glycine ligase [Dehalococcoidia bacterium]